MVISYVIALQWQEPLTVRSMIGRGSVAGADVSSKAIFFLEGGLEKVVLFKAFVDFDTATRRRRYLYLTYA